MDKHGFILAIDQGTTSTKSSLIDSSGLIIGSSYQEIKQYFPSPGWVEHDPEEVFQSVIDTVENLLDEFEISPTNIKSIGITNQRETTLIWDRETGKPIYNAIVWQCRRSTEICQKYEDMGLKEKIHNITGLTVDPYFCASKITWLLENVNGARELAVKGRLAFGTVDSWIIWNLTNGLRHITDYTNASRTMLFDIRQGCWSEELAEAMDIPLSILPEVVPSSGVSAEAGGNYFGGQTIPIAGIIGDQQGSLFGQACFKEGMVKTTYGTGAFILANLGYKPIASKNGLLTTIAWNLEGRSVYALEGSVFSAGSTIQWLRDELGIIEYSDESESLAEQVSDNGGVYFVPAFSGLGAPYWDPRARATFSGISRGTNAAHITRAALESIAFQCQDVFSVMRNDMKKELDVLRVDGGATDNALLMQFQADLSEVEIQRSLTAEATSLGAAYLAGLGCDFWRNMDEIASLWVSGNTWKPDMLPSVREKLKDDWSRAIGRAGNWIQD